VAFNATITPSASAGAHIEGDIDLGIASGGVSAIVDLLSVSTPVAANVALTVDTAPGPGHCTVGYRGDLNGTLQLSSLGGEVDLEATFGVCPFCVSDSWTLVSWDGVSAPPVTLFDFPFGDAVPLNPALCDVSLTTTITQPPASQTVTFGLPVTLSGTAYRPATAGQPLATAITDCSRFAWSTDNLSGPSPDVLGAVSGPDLFNNCSQQITFGSSGQPTRTITLTVTDQFGESGTASEVVNVAAPPAGPSVSIACPVPTYTCDQSGNCFTLPCVDILSFADANAVAAGPVLLTGTVIDADPTAVLSIDWTATPTAGGSPIDVCLDANSACVVLPSGGAGLLSDVVAMAWLPPPAFGSYVVSLVATDSNGLSATDRMTYTFQPTVK
jgi:hypothetical protein